MYHGITHVVMQTWYFVTCNELSRYATSVNFDWAINEVLQLSSFRRTVMQHPSKAHPVPRLTFGHFALTSCNFAALDLPRLVTLPLLSVTLHI
jgi:hypothetical protein